MTKKSGQGDDNRVNIYSREPLSETETKERQLYVTYFKEDHDLAAPIMDALDVRGTTYVCTERCLELCTQDDYIRNTTDTISDCKVSIVMFSKAMFEEKNTVIQEVLWYEIGYMVSLGVKLVLYFLDIDKSERNSYLSTTPVRQVQGTDDIDELFSLLDSMQVAEKIFYDSPEINRYASKRIKYVKISALMNIYRKDMEEIFNAVSEIDDDVESQEELLEELLAEMNCGCTVLRFNDESRLGKEVEPYYPEVHTLVRDYPIKLKYAKPILVKSNAAPDVYATMRAEFILPVHALLGVTFKPFISVKRISHFRTQHLQKILGSNSHNESNSNDDIAVIKTDKEQRVYFLFDVDTAEAGEGFSAYGEKLNHIWPA